MRLRQNLTTARFQKSNFPFYWNFYMSESILRDYSYTAGVDLLLTL
jgi:hypothetical protein